jgi:1,4-alpha-glucan branching enzyme
MQTISPYINAEKQTIEFYLQSDHDNKVSFEGITQVSLAGSFNHWSQDVLLMNCDSNGVWKIEIPLLPRGKYHYKFLVDDKVWLEDVANSNREPDGLSGFNSVLIV